MFEKGGVFALEVAFQNVILAAFEVFQQVSAEWRWFLELKTRLVDANWWGYQLWFGEG